MNVAEELLKDKNGGVIKVPSGATLKATLATMAEHNIGAILVEKDGAVIGIWTERDLLRNVASLGFSIEDDVVDRHMTTDLKFCDANDSVYKIMDQLLGLGIRHLLVKKAGQYIGIISARDVMRATIRAKNMELAQCNASIGWDYYEEWGYTPQG